MSDESPFAGWLRDYEERLAKEHDDARQEIARLCGQLAELGIDTVRIEYDGYGDSGAIEQLCAFVSEKEIDLPASIDEELRTAAESILPDGWQDNDGAFGVLVLNVAERRLTREHSWRVQDTNYEEQEWDL